MLYSDRLQAFIKQHHLFEQQQKVLVAVSGGRDSVLLARLFNAAGFNFGIAHCNFRLRGDEAEGDELFVSELAAGLGVPFHSAGFDTRDVAAQEGISIQMAARDLRYSWLEKVRAAEGYDYIALAHHQNDVVETMLINLVRGTGIAGLHGILPKTGNLIRPLLFLTRGEIDQFFNEFDTPFREDSSNNSTKYARNKIRLEVIPALKALNPNLEETFAANRERFAELEQLLHIRVSELREKLFRTEAGGDIIINLDGLRELVPLQTLLYELFRPYGFTDSVLRDLSDSWDRTGRRFYSADHVILTDRSRLILSEKHASAPEQALIHSDSVEVKWDECLFRVEARAAEDWRIQAGNHVAQLDHDRLQFPLLIRSWQQGDHFYPLGMKGRKKISDLFVDLKIPLDRKARIGVVENGNGDIIWVSGLRIDDRYKITEATKKVFILEQFV